MRLLSATECISPAIERTKLVLFTPFRKGRTWKLCATAYFCRGGTMFFPFPVIYLFLLPAVHKAGDWAVILLVAVVLVMTALFLFFFYLFSRLQFAYFDIVLNRGEFVAPAWRKYGPSSFAWTGAKALFGVALTLAFAIPIAAYIPHLMPLFRSMQPVTPGQPPSPQFMEMIGAFYAGYGLFLLIFGLVFLISSLLADFVVPSLALEDTGLAEACRRMAVLMRREPAEFALYTLLKVGLGFAGYMGAILIWEIAFLLGTLVVAAVAGGIGYALYLAGVSTAILIVLAVPLGIAWYVFLLYSMMFAIGPVFTYLDAYALYFLSGRYPLLGEMLDRSTPPPAYAYAAPYPPYPPAYPPQSGPPVLPPGPAAGS